MIDESTSSKSKPSSEAGFGVYVHWPFCAAKCPYCDFNSHVRHQPVDQPRFVKAFQQELRFMAERSQGEMVQSIFLGGGTPSLMQPETVGAILDEIAKLWPMDKAVEISMEANPTSVEAERFAGYRAAGVNRVSLGVQALNDADLKALGRLHSVADAQRAFDVARTHFDRTSFDLIYARPHQTPEQWRSELREATTMAVDHLSLYQLTIEPETQFELLYKAGKLSVPDPDISAAMFEITQEETDKAGMPAYEVSNHARPGAECRHNLVYWRYGLYAGVGPGAHGRLQGPQSRIATSTEKHPERWLEMVETRGNGLIEKEELSFEQAGDEFLIMGLRLREGINPARYTALSGRVINEKRVQDLKDNAMLESLPDGRLRVTPQGLMVLDAVVADLAA
jgi:putative oxygen-independent coproporphyrinogen III oxidase